ncbi:unnamed protein product [Tenebrio molitor]|nr:unnamed protein product [Tenebrio molitor]
MMNLPCEIVDSVISGSVTSRFCSKYSARSLFPINR